MKSYKKATLVAKNGRSGSYAAGCPSINHQSHENCRYCEAAY